MEIYIVQPTDTVYTIAKAYNVSTSRLIWDNNLTDSGELVAGQALVILFPSQTYTVKSGDTLESIAQTYNIPLMQLFRNNNYLFDRTNIYTGETIVISYNNDKGEINTFGYAANYIDINILNKTLPFLTYLCISGNQINENADIISIDDVNLIKISKDFGVAPIMLLPSLTIQGLNDFDSTYNIFINVQSSDKLINNITNILKAKGYHGVLITFEYLNSANLVLYQNYIKKLSKRLKIEGLKLFVTISPVNTNITIEDIKIIDSDIEGVVDGIAFMDYNRGLNINPPPGPVTSIKKLHDFLAVATTIISENIIDIGAPAIGFDWELPYIPNVSKSVILKYYTALELASNQNSIINFDEPSQTPYFTYSRAITGVPIQHIVWFVDARTINSLVNLIPEFNLNGTGIWIIMYYFSQIWSIINSQYTIKKILPEPQSISTIL